MPAGFDADLDAILQRLIRARGQGRIATNSRWLAASALIEIERSAGLMHAAALAGLQGRARLLMGVEAETPGEAATRLRRARAASRRKR